MVPYGTAKGHCFGLNVNEVNNGTEGNFTLLIFLQKSPILLPLSQITNYIVDIGEKN